MRFFIFALLLLFSSNTITAQISTSSDLPSKLKDVIYLKNGSIIRGSIIEQVPNQHVKIENSNLDVLVFQLEHVDRISKEFISNKSPYTGNKRSAALIGMNKISINPIQIIGYNIANIEYERGFKNGKTGIAFYIGRTGLTTRSIDDYMFYTQEQNLSFKKYSNNINTSSFWYGLQLSVTSANIIHTEKFENRAYGIGTFGVTGKLGYQIIYNAFYTDIFAGLGAAITDDLFETAVYSGDIQPTPLFIIFGLKGGISF